ncbi:MAG TPA: endonuclease domain-containing protein, partial [Pseudoxanthomonas sp.]|nr:endonuclease domain-containing protein [Pseudoxanthomonas sp.]
MDEAERMRAEPTDAERRMWTRLRNGQTGFKFRRQHRVGGYIVDFVCVEAGLVIEVDGGQHLERSAQDEERTAYLESVGLRVIRFWNDDALLKTDLVMEEVWHALQQPPHPSPLPRRRGRGGRSQSQGLSQS